MARILRYAPNGSKAEIEAYFNELTQQGRKAKYINSLINTVRVYAEYLGQEDLKRWQDRREDPSIVATMSDEEIEAFLTLPRPKGASAKAWARYTVFFAICAYTGLRPGECAQLKQSDVDFGARVFYIRESKTRTGVAKVPIPENITGLVREFIESLESEYLFPSARGGNRDGVTPVIDNVDWHYAFHKRIKIMKIKRPGLRAYSMRHSYGTALMASGVDIHYTKRLMRHSDIRTTELYVHLNVEDLRKAQAKLPNIRKATDPHTILRAMVELVKGFEVDKDPRFKYQLIEDSNSVRFECAIEEDKKEGALAPPPK
jgi:integrase/recombinase XerD